MVGGIESCICEALAAGDPRRIWDALPELMHFAAGSYFGKEAADEAYEETRAAAGERAAPSWKEGDDDRAAPDHRRARRRRALLHGHAPPPPSSPGPPRHPGNLVTAHQRLRLLAAMADAARRAGVRGVPTTRVTELAGVSSRTFYKHFEDLWDCALAAYVATSDRLCAAIEDACAECDPRQDPLDAGVEAALAFCAEEPEATQLLSAHAPLEASAIAAARRILISRLAAMLRRGRGSEGEAPQPPGLDERLIDATFTFVASRISAGGSAQLADLAPELTTILSRPRRAA